jgi:hypothetical protein
MKRAKRKPRRRPKDEVGRFYLLERAFVELHERVSMLEMFVLKKEIDTSQAAKVTAALIDE